MTDMSRKAVKEGRDDRNLENTDITTRSRPIAHVGIGQTATEGSPVHLHGHAGPTEGDHNNFSYQWRQKINDVVNNASPSYLKVNMEA
jgi:hypothetical protein